MARFTLPRDLYHGENALEALKTLDGKRAIVVVGGGSMKRFGFLDKVCDYLKQAGMEVCLFEGVEADPSVETVMRGAEKMREFQPDWIVSVGGGSPIDAAKAMWAFYEYPDTTFEQLCIPFNFPKLRTKAKFCAIPSTSGTATEVTAFSVITDYQKGIKYPLADFNITPDVAIVDPALAETMPKKLTAHTGMDAMTHAIEAYVSTLHCDYTDPLALHAIQDDQPRPGQQLQRRHEAHAQACITHSAWLVWRSPTLCWVSFIRWHTRPVLLTAAVISFTDVPMRCTCQRSSNSTAKILKQTNVTVKSQPPSVWSQPPMR